MQSNVPPHLVDDYRALESGIREAFKGVTREGGMSWSETEIVDGPGAGDDEQRAEARALDTDRTWTELADDENWDAGPGVGGWAFLDPTSFRYYLPAAMIRAIRGDPNAFSSFTLDIILDAKNWDARLAQLALLNHSQRRCVARFVHFMIGRDAADGDTLSSSEWQRIYDEYWKSVDHV